MKFFLTATERPLEVTAIHSAQDYRLAIDQLETFPISNSGAIIDCFFPMKTGSNDSSLGEEAVRRLESTDPHEKEVRAAIDSVREYADVDEDLNGMLRGHFQSGMNTARFKDGSFFKAIAQVGSLKTNDSKTTMNLIIKNTLRGHRGQGKDYYGALRAAIKESESNQPLGILVAAEAERRGIPFVLATSTHHHDILTQPIQNYASQKGWALVDCRPNSTEEKSQQTFWHRAYGVLESRAKTKVRL